MRNHQIGFVVFHHRKTIYFLFDCVCVDKLRGKTRLPGLYFHVYRGLPSAEILMYIARQAPDENQALSV